MMMLIIIIGGIKMECALCHVYVNYKRNFQKIEGKRYCPYCAKKVKQMRRQTEAIVISDCHDCIYSELDGRFTSHSFKIGLKCQIYKYSFFRNKYKNHDCKEFVKRMDCI